MITADEVDFGLVLHMDPDELVARGATYSCADALRVRGNHFFLCVGADENGGVWLPLFSRPGFGRAELSREGRQGHPTWRNGRFHYHVGQIWSASHDAVGRAAAAGADLSYAGNRNRLADELADAVAVALPEFVG